jgi:hypothetical protein
MMVTLNIKPRHQLIFGVVNPLFRHMMIYLISHIIYLNNTRECFYKSSPNRLEEILLNQINLIQTTLYHISYHSLQRKKERDHELFKC